VWLGWLLVRTIALFAPFADDRDADRAQRWRAHAAAVKSALEREAWDGAWYRRATFDDGTWLGSKDSEECRIDSIAQSWGVLSGAADPERASRALASLEEHLVRRDERLALLFTPPFDRTTRDPGYIKGYPPGIRENGGQYSHAAMWAILALAQHGDGAGAADLFALVNPINHSKTADDVARYKVEPYVVAADVYSVPPHVGRGGWTWYTGSAAWMYRAGVEGILGIRREGDFLVIDPRIPAAWPGFEATVNVASTRYDVRVENQQASGDGVAEVTLDGVPIAPAGEPTRVPLNGGKHDLLIRLRTTTEEGARQSVLTGR
jgi:cyclic beta-1,2-glucan synthetase